MPSSGRFGVFLRGISPPAGGEFLCPRRQRNQNAAGDGFDEHFVLIAAFPRTPFTGVTPWGGQNPSGARNQECLGAVPSGPTGGLCFEKIEAAAVPRLRLGFRTNAPGPFSTVGAHSVRPRAGLGPAPTREMGPSLYPRRGGCPHPPDRWSGALPLSAKCPWAWKKTPPLPRRLNSFIM